MSLPNSAISYISLFNSNTAYNLTAEGLTVIGNMALTGTLNIDTIDEYTAGHGTVVESVTFKNGVMTTVTSIASGTFYTNSGLTISGTTISNPTGGIIISPSTNVSIPTSLKVDTIDEYTASSGVELLFTGSRKLITTSGGISITGDIVITGTVDGVDISTLNTQVSTNTTNIATNTTNIATNTTNIATNTTNISTNTTDIATINQLTTKGDILGYSTNYARIPIGSNSQVLTADSTQTLGLKWATPSGGTITGPGSSTDNAIVRWDGSGGATIQNSTVIVADNGDTSGMGILTVDTAIVVPYINYSTGVALRYNNSQKLITTTSGISTTGTIDCSDISGSAGLNVQYNGSTKIATTNTGFTLTGYIAGIQSSYTPTITMTNGSGTLTCNIGRIFYMDANVRIFYAQLSGVMSTAGSNPFASLAFTYPTYNTETVSTTALLPISYGGDVSSVTAYQTSNYAYRSATTTLKHEVYYNTNYSSKTTYITFWLMYTV